MNSNFGGGTFLDPAPEINQTIGSFFSAFIMLFSFIRNFFKSLSGFGAAPEDGAAE